MDVKPKTIIIRRQHPKENFGFTLRHVVVFPPAAENGVLDCSGGVENLVSINKKSRLLEIGPIGTALIQNVQQGGPADLAGLANGDRILAINGCSVSGNSYEEIVGKIHNTGTNLCLMVVPGDRNLIYEDSEEVSLGSDRLPLYENSVVETSPEDYSTGRESSSSYVSCKSGSTQNWTKQSPINFVVESAKTPPMPIFSSPILNQWNFNAASSDQDTLTSAEDTSRPRSRSSDPYQKDRIAALIREMKPMKSGGTAAAPGHVPLRTAFSQDSLYYNLRGPQLMDSRMGPVYPVNTSSPRINGKYPLGGAQHFSMGNLTNSGHPQRQFRPPPPSYNEAVAAARAQKGAGQMSRADLQKSLSGTSGSSLAESVNSANSYGANGPHEGLVRAASTSQWVGARRGNLPPPLQLQRGGSADNVRFRDQPIPYSSHRKQHLPEIRENIAVGMPLSPGGNPLQTGKVAETVKTMSSNASASGAMQTETMKSAGGVPERLSRLHRVGNLARQFEEGPVNPVGTLKLYHAQSYKRELARVCQDRTGKVWAKAQCFDGSLPSSPRLSVVSSVSDVSGNLTPSATPFGPLTPRSLESPRQIPLPTFASGPNSPLLNSESSSVLPDSRKRFAIHSEHFEAVKSSPDIFCADPKSPRTPLPLFASARRNRPESFMVAVTGDSPVSRDSVTHSFPTTPSPSVQFASIPENGVFHFTSPTAPSSMDVARNELKNKFVERVREEDMGSPGFLSDTEVPETGSQTRWWKLKLFKKRRKSLQPNLRLVSFMRRRSPPAFPSATTPRGCSAQDLKFGSSSAERNENRSDLMATNKATVTENRLQNSAEKFAVPTGPNPPQNARIQKFIHFFATGGDQISASGSEQEGHKSQVIPQEENRWPSEPEVNEDFGRKEADREMKKPDSPVSPASGQKQIRLGNLTKFGSLGHKETALGSSRRVASSEKGWSQVWAVLHGHKLFLCQEKPDNWDSKNVILPSDGTTVIDVSSSIVDIAYDANEGSAWRKKYIFRLSTQQQTEHLFQAEKSEDMLRWIEDLQRSARSGGEVGGSDSMALIIKRYEAKSQAVSPAVKPKKALKMSAQNSAPISSGPSVDEDTDTGVSSQAHNGEASTATPDQVDSKTGEATPSRSRKWIKVRKSGSCPVQDQKSNSQSSQTPNSLAVFGQTLQKCPTSGDDDYVPLFVQLCVKVVEAHGLEAVGVYRIPGNTAAVNALMTSLDKGFEHVDFSDPRWKDVNVVSSLLKAFFRKLSEPILTDKYYPIFIDANRMPDHFNRLRKLRTLVHKLPRHNYETLKYLLMHLRKVVGRSDVNKMEARNLALMFGPSCVRPSGDNMAAMVTHMSDQCKIMESLIIYYDWIYGSSADSPPPGPAPAEVHDDPMSSSFSDMSDLLRRVNRTDDDLEKTKDNIVRSILHVRRGSKKGKASSKEDPASTPPPQETSSGRLPYRKTVSDRPVTALAAPMKQKQKQKAVTVEEAVNGRFQERNIDEEIVTRSSKIQKESISEEPLDFEESSDNSEKELLDIRTVRAGNTEMDLAVDAMRRQREEQIYKARRIFISGGSTTDKTGSVGDSTNVEKESDSEKLDGLVHHTRHLNLSGCSETAMDVLSPETREKIRRLHTDGQLLKLKEQRQNYRLRQVENERQRVERAWARAKADAEQEDYLDEFANDPVHPDALSVTSDYSTTSSATGGDGLAVPPSSARSMMTHSCNGALPLSDYSSTDSPLTPHLPQRLDSLTQSQASVNSTGSENVSNSENSVYDRKRLRHIAPFGSKSTRTPPTSASLVAREKAWYELETEDSRDTAMVIDGSSSVVDQNRNLTTASNNSKVPIRSLTGTERPISRISQKIRFRSKSSSADKRKDPRRHTLTDLEHLKSALFGTGAQDQGTKNGQAGQNGAPQRHQSQKAHRSNSGAPLVLGKVAKSKTGKLKAWFKESFRKSSPELYDPTESEMGVGEMPLSPTQAALVQ